MGAVVDLLVVSMAGGAGAAFRGMQHRAGRPITAGRLWLMGVLIHGAMLVAVFGSAPEMPPDAFRSVGLPVLIFFPIATVFVGMILNDQQVRRAFVDRLSESHERLSATLRGIGDAVISTDARLRVRTMNPAAESITGCQEGDARGRLLAEIITLLDGATREPLEDAASRVLREGREVKAAMDAVLVRPDGKEYIVEHGAAPTYGDGDGVTGAVLVLRDISEARAAAQSADNSRKRFERALEQIPDVVVIYDRALRIRYINEATRKVTGQSAEYFLGKREKDIFPPEVYEPFMPILRAALEKRETGSVEVDILLPGAGMRNLYITCVPILDNNGEVLEVLGITRDLTERKESMAALRERDERLGLILEFAPVAIALLDRDMNYMLASRRWYTDFDLGEADLAGQSHYDVFPDTSDAWRDVYRRVLAGESIYRDEEPFERANGTIDWLRRAVIPWKDAEGEVGGIIIFSEVITKRKQAEAALKEREALLRIAGRAARLGGWSVDLASNSVAWSDELYEIHGVATDYEPRMPDAVSFFLPEWRGVIMGAYEECARHGTPYDVEVELMTARGRRIWVRSIGEPVRDDDGNIVRVQGAFQDISDIKRYEDSLQQSHVRFRQLADAMPLIVWTANPDGALDYTSVVFEAYSGQPGHVATDKGWLDVVHPDDAAQAWSVWSEAYPQGGDYLNEFRLRRKDGMYRWHHIQGVPIRDREGKIVKWYGTATDIHDLKESEAELQRMAGRLTATLESITDAFCILDRDWRYTYLNPEAERLARIPREKLLGQVLTEALPAVKGSEMEAHFLRAAEENQARTFETYFAPLGIWLEMRAYPSAEGMSVYYRDITEQHSAQQELQKVTNRLEAILSFSPLLIAVFSPEGEYLVANSASCEFYGLPPGGLEGKNLRELLPAEIAGKLSASIAKVLSTGRSHSREIDIGTDEALRIFSAVFFPLKNTAGDVVSVGGIANDITESKTAESERTRLVEQLHQAQKMDAVGRLAGGVAHDFNNMLGVILGYTELALNTLEGGAPLESELREIQTAATRSADLTRQLLAFARQQTIAPQVLDLNDVVESMLRILGRLIGENVDLVWRPGKNLVPVRVDPTQVDQILANLAVNARDAINGTGQLCIETALFTADESYCSHHPEAVPGTFVMVAVRDNGCGMDSKTVEQVFEPFFTTKPQGQGTGLGLATVYGIVRQNDGFIEIESELGAGSTFKIYFPECSDPKASQATEAERPALPGGTETVLLVEDEAALLALGARQLALLGYQVIPASSPLEALSTAEAHPGGIDLLLTDVIMPEMDGKELSRMLLALRPGLKTLFMSGYTADTIAHRGVLEDGVHFLQKPFKTQSIAVKIRETLDGDGSA